MNAIISGSVPFFNGLRLLSIAMLMSLLFVLCVEAQNVTTDTRVSSAPAGSASSVAARYPSGSIQSVDAAEQALVEVDEERSRIEAQFASDERACFPKFFTTSCVDDAKERRRHALAQLRSVEVEAKAFRRRARVADRDKDLAEKQAGEEAEALNRAKEQKDRDLAAAKKNADNVQKSKQSAEANSKTGSTVTTGTTDREKAHQAKLQQLQAEEAADAQKRAENVAAYEKKVQQAESRQREIAAKKAEKERERKVKKPATPSTP